MLKVGVVCFLGCASASWVSAENLQLPLMTEPVRPISGASEFVIALPRHITLQPRSRLTFVLHFRTPPGAPSETLPIFVNGQELQPRFIADAPALALRIEADVPESLLAAGLNTIGAVLPRQFGTCEVRRAESHLALNFERVPLFPELRRFPESVTEEKLLRGETESSTVSIILPAARRDVHLRGCAIIGARFGQQRYFGEADFDLVEIANWPSAENRNAIVVGRTDEIASLPFLAPIAEKLSALEKERGLLAEFVLGDFPNQRRWIVATGSDDAGLENALLTLGSTPALNALPPSPVEITPAPEVTLQTEVLARPSRSQTSFKDLGWREIEVGRLPAHRFGWRLPPGYTLELGELTLNFFHPKEISSGYLEIYLGPHQLGGVALTPDNAEGGSAKFNLPEAVRGSDPAMFTFRAITTNVQHQGPIAIVLGNSTLETMIQPARVEGLQHLDTLLMRDSFLRKTAFVLPGTPTLAEAKFVADLARRLGRLVPSSPLLWPEACTFESGGAPARKSLNGRSAVVFAPVVQWRNAVPENTPLVIDPVGRDAVRIQGRRHRIASFEPSVTLVQLVPAPWSANEFLITVGGWHDVDLSAAKRLITLAAGEGAIYGNTAALDSRGRFVAHDSRRPARDYFAQRLRHQIPAGLTVEETVRRVSEASARREQSLFINRFLAWFVGIVIAATVLGRLLLVWERGRHYKRTTEKSPGVAS
jgi:hypothetical protein